MDTSALIGTLQKLDIEADTVRARLEKLEKVDWIGKGSAWPLPCVRYKMGRYLELVYTLPQGQRVIYIGADPEKKRAALEQVHAQEEYLILSDALEKLLGLRRSIEARLYLMEREASALLMDFSFAY